MLSFLRRLWGQNAPPAAAEPEAPDRRREPRTSPATVIAESPLRHVKTPEPEPGDDPGADLTLEDTDARARPSSMEDGVDPYNTGAFYNRPDAWRKAKD